jgi:hypothetical protein
VLIGLRPDPVRLAEVQVFEPIDVSVSSRPHPWSRPVRYREIHVTAMAMAIGGAFLANKFTVGRGPSGWGFWLVPMLPVAWVLVWFYRKSRVSSLGSLVPVRLVSTLVEPGQITRTCFGITRVYDAASSVLVIRAGVRSPKHLARIEPIRLPIRITLINARGQRSSITVQGVDHPTIADVLARWTFRAEEPR